jgi:tyrosyl-tRNA synthetase
MKNLTEQLKIINNGLQETAGDLELKIKESIERNIPLRVKCGIDPTGSDLHIGHMLPFKKLKEFQDLGHTAIIIIGDVTAQIGDPTGRNKTRQPLKKDIVLKNAKLLLKQLSKIIDLNKTEIRFQSEWMEKMTLNDSLQLMSLVKVNKLLSNDTFSNRLDQGFTLGMHEIMVPVLQALDSVKVSADIEIGGIDQWSNVIMGKTIQKEHGQKVQVGIFLPILTGTCGRRKMSKSFKNFISINDSPKDKFGKTMSIPDTLLKEWSSSLNVIDHNKVDQFHPKKLKEKIAFTIVELFHDKEIAQKELENFNKQFKNKIAHDIIKIPLENIPLVDLLLKHKFKDSKKQIKTLIVQGAISRKDTGEKIKDINLILDHSFKNVVLKVGKLKFIKLV